MTTQAQISLVEKTVMELCHPNNTVTTLEVKTELRKKHPNMPWYQSDISSIMNDLYMSGNLDYNDNGSYRVYFIPGTQNSINVTSIASPVVIKVAKVKTTPKKATISKSKALDLIENSGGKFFGVTFTKKDNSEKNMTCRYISTTNLGYIKVKDMKATKNNDNKAIKSVNLQTLTGLRISNTIYKVS